MASNLLLKLFSSSNILGTTVSIGNQTEEYVVALDGQYTDLIRNLPNNTIWTAWDAASSNLDSFKWAWILTTRDMQVELTCDADNSTGGKRLFVIQTRQNIPMFLPSNVSIAGYVENFGGGTLDVIDRIRIRNVSGQAGDARVLLLK